MKKILAAAICTVPFALAPSVYAQATTGGGAATGAPATTSASASPDASATPRTPDTRSGTSPSSNAPNSASGSSAAGGGAASNTGSGMGGSSGSTGGKDGGASGSAGSAGSSATGTSGASAAAAGGGSAAMAATAASSDWSINDDMIGESVYNENDDKVGDIRDVLVSRDGKLTSFVVGVGGFLGMGEHDVALPFDRITKTGDRLVLAGYTKDQLKELPKYEKRDQDRGAGDGARGGDRSITTGTSGNPGTSGTPGNAVTPAPGASGDTAPPTSTTR